MRPIQTMTSSYWLYLIVVTLFLSTNSGCARLAENHHDEAFQLLLQQAQLTGDWSNVEELIVNSNNNNNNDHHHRELLQVGERLYINAGGPEFTDNQGLTWQADQSIFGGTAFTQSYSGNNPLYATGRQGVMLYNVPLPNGEYDVTLHFADVESTATNQRVFDIICEGQTDTFYELDIYDIGQSNPTTLSRTVFVSDGNLSLFFFEVYPKQGVPLINGIEIFKPAPATVPILVNVGSDSSFVDNSGRTWLPDKNYLGKSRRTQTSNAIAETSDDTLYQTSREGIFRYELEVVPGTYTVKLHFVETDPVVNNPGEHAFDVILEGRILPRVDIVQRAGGTFRATILEETVSITDGRLSMLVFETFPRKGTPVLSGIELIEPVVAVTPAPTPAPTPLPTPAPVAPSPPTPTGGLDGTWELFNNQNLAARHEACFVMVGDKGFLIGGRESQDVDIFDPSTQSWSKGQTAPQLLHHMQCVGLGGKIYLPAAWTNWYPREDTVDVMWVYDTIQDQWSSLPAMPEYRRRGSAAVVVDGTKIWVSHGTRGGHEQDNFATSYGWIDYFETSTGTWVLGNEAGFPDAPNPRDHTGGALVNGRICVAGGRNGGVKDWPAVSPTDCFDPVSKTWTVEANIPQDRSGAAYGTSCDGRLLVAGGERDISNRVDVFDGTSWETFTNGLIDSRHGTGLGVDCQRNLIYIASGSPNNGGGATNTMEIYTP